jgi:hypothetical protein
MMVFVCENCSKSFHDEDLPRRGSICFGCHVKSLHIGFSHGKDNFHGDTIGEKQRKIVSDAASKGITAEPVGTRWI